MIGGLGDESAAAPTGKSCFVFVFVFVLHACGVRVCVRPCVLDLREGCYIELSRVRCRRLRRRLILERNNGLGLPIWGPKTSSQETSQES